ncbi:hypothetical protein NL676_028933 [Syzygium grande]|nr:hypothetical protein NL676_028933 [Syzygium grande]
MGQGRADTSPTRSRLLPRSAPCPILRVGADLVRDDAPTGLWSAALYKKPLVGTFKQARSERETRSFLGAPVGAKEKVRSEARRREERRNRTWMRLPPRNSPPVPGSRNCFATGCDRRRSRRRRSRRRRVLLRLGESDRVECVRCAWRSSYRLLFACFG